MVKMAEKEDKREYLKKIRKRRKKGEINKREENELLQQIEKLQDKVEKEVLICRYIKMMEWIDVCDEIGYSWAQTHRIHRKAIEHLMLQS